MVDMGLELISRKAKKKLLEPGYSGSLEDAEIKTIYELSAN